MHPAGSARQFGLDQTSGQGQHQPTETDGSPQPRRRLVPRCGSLARLLRPDHRLLNPKKCYPIILNFMKYLIILLIAINTLSRGESISSNDVHGEAVQSGSISWKISSSANSLYFLYELSSDDYLIISISNVSSKPVTVPAEMNIVKRWDQIFYDRPLLFLHYKNGNGDTIGEYSVVSSFLINMSDPRSSFVLLPGTTISARYDLSLVFPLNRKRDFSKSSLDLCSYMIEVLLPDATFKSLVKQDSKWKNFSSRIKL